MVVRGEERQYLVAPFAGAWIEIRVDGYVVDYVMSHPSRVRGLKLIEC